MTACSMRFNISRAILTGAYEHSDEATLITIEQTESVLRKLAEAGDSLSEYLSEINDPEIRAALLLIDRRITERRRAYDIPSAEIKTNLLHQVMTGSKRTVVLGDRSEVGV